MIIQPENFTQIEENQHNRVLLNVAFCDILEC